MERVILHRMPTCDHRSTQYERHSWNTVLQTRRHFLLPLVSHINVAGPLPCRVKVVVLILSFLNVGLYFLDTASFLVILRPWLLGCGVRVVLVLSVGQIGKRASSLNIHARESYTNQARITRIGRRPFQYNLACAAVSWLSSGNLARIEIVGQ